MTLQNRVTPFGDIVADSARGLLMGNRGILHGSDRRLGSARWRHQAWIVCVLAFRGRRREVMAPGRYTELFFLDEATAMAAGHRPCAECRREDHRRYAAAWASGHGLADRPAAPEIDRALHAARVTRTRRQVTFSAGLGDLPDGTMVEQNGKAWLLWRGRLHRWSPAGYRESAPPPTGLVRVLTPRPSVLALAAGFAPLIHPSAERAC